MTNQRKNFFNHQTRLNPRKKRRHSITTRITRNSWNLRPAAATKKPRQPTWVKSLWFIITLGCVCLCFYQVGLRICEFTEYPINLDVRMIRQTSFDFPSVTLCSGISTHRVKHWINVMECEKNKSECSDSELEDLQNLSNYNDVMESWLEYETKIEDVSIGKSCPMFSSKSIHCSPRPASEVMNTDIVDTIWGRCLSLTLKKKTMQFKGPFTWISINWEYRFNRSGDESLYFFVHREGEKLVHDAPFIADTIRVGFESTISITAKEYYALNTNKHPCVSAEATTQCFNQCVERIIEARLSCRLPFINSTKLTLCDNIRKIMTAFQTADDVYNRLKRNICKCPRQCVSTKYKMNMDVERVNDQNTTKLVLLYVDDLKEELIEKSAFSQSALCSEIGGSLGLYLGVSIINLIRLIENLIYRVLRRIKKFKMSRFNNNTSPR